MAKRITSAADLKAIRDQAVADIDLRTGPKELRVTVHMGTCGIAAGARDVLAVLMEELAVEGAAKVTLQQAGCAGLCDQEPMLSLTDKTGAVFRYGRLDKNKAREVVRQHVVRGIPATEYLIKS
ncbi:MAG: (2Fe-2S) ferredoxin domain-containing protein [Planctomycetota bacterium]|jgi:NADP-reducing hydrogenase subunit HndB|nr:(2Fe-2S) ferredoxin domain-containing protein [Planctomycetota bacterium]